VKVTENYQPGVVWPALQTLLHGMDWRLPRSQPCCTTAVISVSGLSSSAVHLAITTTSSVVKLLCKSSRLAAGRLFLVMQN